MTKTLLVPSQVNSQRFVPAFCWACVRNFWLFFNVHISSKLCLVLERMAQTRGATYEAVSNLTGRWGSSWHRRCILRTVALCLLSSSFASQVFYSLPQCIHPCTALNSLNKYPYASISSIPMLNPVKIQTWRFGKTIFTPRQYIGLATRLEKMWFYFVGISNSKFWARLHRLNSVVVGFGQVGHVFIFEGASPICTPSVSPQSACKASKWQKGLCGT